MSGILYFWAGIGACLLSVIVVYRLVLYPMYISPLRHLPGPKDHHIVIGQRLNQYWSDDPVEPYLTWMRKWPNAPLIRYFDVLHRDAVLVNNPVVYRSVMSDNAHAFARSIPFRRLIGDVIGDGLVFADSNAHRAQRRTLERVFPVTRLHKHVPVYNDKALRLVLDIDSAATKRGKVDIKGLISDVTLDIIGMFSLGFDISSGAKQRQDFVKCYSSLFEQSQGNVFTTFVDRFVPIHWLPFRENSALMKAGVMLRRVVTEIVDGRIQNMSKNPSGFYGGGELMALDFLTYVIDTQYQAAHDPCTKTDLIEQVLNYLATGHETTAGALTFAIHQLGQRPDIVKKMRAEAKNASITHCEFSKPEKEWPFLTSFNQVDSLVYLDHVLKEALRLLPPVAGIPRVATKDLIICNQLIPKGTTVMPIPAVVHHNPVIWGRDVDEFRPERWEIFAGGKVEAEHFAWFGLGNEPRACIGRTLAALSAKIILLQIIVHFDFETVDPSNLPVVNPSGQTRAVGPVEMRFRHHRSVFHYDQKKGTYICLDRE